MNHAPHILEHLRQRIRELEGHALHAHSAHGSGVPAVDEVLGGLPRPGMVEVVGKRGTGVTRLALVLAAAATRRERVAWFDPSQVLYPPTARHLGVQLQNFVLVRPPAERALWSLEQLLRSGCFGLVVAGTGTAVGTSGRLLARAARLGHCTLLLLQRRHCTALPADLRLQLDGEQAHVTRSRRGVAGQTVCLPPWPEELHPWSQPSR